MGPLKLPNTTTVQIQQTTPVPNKPILGLANVVLTAIFKYMTPIHIISCKRVSKVWQVGIENDKICWEFFHRNLFPHLWQEQKNLTFKLMSPVDSCRISCENALKSPFNASQGIFTRIKLEGHQNGVQHLHVTARGLLFSVDFNMIKIWKYIEGKWDCIETLNNVVSITGIQFAADEKLILKGLGSTFYVWECKNKKWENTEIINPSTSRYNEILKSQTPTDNLQFTLDKNNVNVWDYIEGKRTCIQTLTDNENPIAWLKPIGNGKFCTGSFDAKSKFKAPNKTINIWERTKAKWECTTTLTSEYPIHCLEVAMDGRFFTGSGSNIEIWNFSVSEAASIWEMTKQFKQSEQSYLTYPNTTIPRLNYFTVFERFNLLSEKTKTSIYKELYKIKYRIDSVVFNLDNAIYLFHTQEPEAKIIDSQRAYAILNYLKSSNWSIEQIAAEFARISEDDLSSKEFLFFKFNQLHGETKKEVFEKLHLLHKPKIPDAEPNYGELAFLNQKGCYSTNKEKSQVLAGFETLPVVAKEKLENKVGDDKKKEKLSPHELLAFWLKKDPNLSKISLEVLPAFNLAVESGNQNLCEILAKPGAKIDATDSNGLNVLHYAILQHQLKIVQKIIQDKQLVGLINSSSNEGGYTPLHIAAYRGDEKAFLMLCEAGAKIDATDSAGRTIFHYAILQHKAEFIQSLIQNKQASALINNGSETPLHFAVCRSYDVICRLLHENGAKIEAIDSPAQRAHLPKFNQEYSHNMLPLITEFMRQNVIKCYFKAKVGAQK